MMITFPALSFLTAPVLFGDLTINFPMIGAFLAWLLIASVVGMLLGILRDRTSPHLRVDEKKVRIADSHAHVDHLHPEAA